MLLRQLGHGSKLNQPGTVSDDSHSKSTGSWGRGHLHSQFPMHPLLSCCLSRSVHKLSLKRSTGLSTGQKLDLDLQKKLQLVFHVYLRKHLLVPNFSVRQSSTKCSFLASLDPYQGTSRTARSRETVPRYRSNLSTLPPQSWGQASVCGHGPTLTLNHLPGRQLLRKCHFSTMKQY